MRRAALAPFIAGCILQTPRDVLLRGTAYYSGVVTAVDGRTGFPLEGVRVEILDGPGPPLWEGQTDRVGRVRFSMNWEPNKRLPATVAVQLSRRGYVRKKALFDAADFRTASGRGRSRKTVELRPGRGSETVDFRGAAGE